MIAEDVVATVPARTGAHRSFARIYVHAPRARGTYGQCGFRVERTQLDALLQHGVRHDAMVMPVLRTDPHP